MLVNGTFDVIIAEQWNIYKIPCHKIPQADM